MTDSGMRTGLKVRRSLCVRSFAGLCLTALSFAASAGLSTFFAYDFEQCKSWELSEDIVDYNIAAYNTAVTYAKNLGEPWTVLKAIDRASFESGGYGVCRRVLKGNQAVRFQCAEGLAFPLSGVIFQVEAQHGELASTYSAKGGRLMLLDYSSEDFGNRELKATMKRFERHCQATRR